jgi:hypothetical protein
MANQLSEGIIESLRQGKPPFRGAEKYSVGNEKLIDGIDRHHFSRIENRGKIRFISGSWGSGKTHLFRILQDKAFQNNCTVSNVEFSKDEVTINKFEKVFYSIVKNISTLESYQESTAPDVSPFRTVLEKALQRLGGYQQDFSNRITLEQYEKATAMLMRNKGIDIDFKKIIQHYWKTYLAEESESALIEQAREEILQWFAGEGDKTAYKKRFEVNKMITKENAKLILQSLVEFIKLSGYRGLVILFDEAEQSYSVMRKAALRDAHNNLMSLINNIEKIPGIFMIYATTPDFFVDPKHGIVLNGALSGRIGKPQNKPPNAFDTVWNLDEAESETRMADYQKAAKNIRKIYLEVNPDAMEKIVSEKENNLFVHDIYEKHPKFAPSKFWRVMITALITKYDNQLEGQDEPIAKIYNDVMSKLKEE